MIGGRRCSEAARRLRQRPDHLELAVMERQEDEEVDYRIATDEAVTADRAAVSESASGRRTRWFHFARSSKNRRKRLHCEDDGEEGDKNSAEETGRRARLAQPEGMNIGSSTQTIVTPLMTGDSFYSLATGAANPSVAKSEDLEQYKQRDPSVVSETKSARSMRRLSQMRRRRSSYYFSGI